MEEAKSHQYIPSPDRDYKVCIVCTTYNHAKYIDRALQGFITQKAPFAFCAVVVDDASTDETQQIINSYAERYPDIIKPILLKENHVQQNRSPIPYILPWAQRSQYVAMCEGDDFWTDIYKIKKQADALDAHPEVAICLNRVQAVKADDLSPRFMIPPTDGIVSEGRVTLSTLMTQELKLLQWCFHTSSFMCRTQRLYEALQFKEKQVPSFPYTDMPILLYCLQHGGWFIDEVMSCYREFSGGWNSTVQANPELNRKMAARVIQGFYEFDNYSNRKYHSIIRRYCRDREFYELLGGHSKNPRYYHQLMWETIFASQRKWRRFRYRVHCLRLKLFKRLHLS